jgi:hypothetical protein
MMVLFISLLLSATPDPIQLQRGIEEGEGTLAGRTGVISSMARRERLNANPASSPKSLRSSTPSAQTNRCFESSVEKTERVFANPETASVSRPKPVRTINFGAAVVRH